MKVVKSSVLRKNLKDYLNQVSESEGIILIPRSGIDSDDKSVIMVSLKEYNSLKNFKERYQSSLLKSVN
ncbi:hypothetical protein WAF17_16490 [Bernardetia sp. ABR2-2B]|uniref:hypothetical protein n=1 Tax=Bernardetia sp. ABR2-2B TaxID=3127472 RepID=UPI0030CA826B